MPTLDLFAPAPGEMAEPIWIGDQACVLPGHALPQAEALLLCVERITRQAPFRHMLTPGGRTMSVALTNCGDWGWTSDRWGYRYASSDPLSRQAWPVMPTVFEHIALTAAHAAGFAHFKPDACLINRYVPGAKLSMHQDRDERDHGHPIVSISLGMPATFVFGGHTRTGPTRKVPLRHGDVVVWGGVDRLRFHGVLPLADEPHPTLGAQRINLTLRKAG